MTTVEPGSRSLMRQVNRRTVMEVILADGPISRVDVAARTGLSKPTVNAIVQELVDEGWVTDVGEQAGGVGRAATLFASQPLAALTIGVDLGGTKARAALADLHGTLLVEHVEPTDPRGGHHVVDQIVQLCRSLADELAPDAWPRVRTIAVGSPGVLDPTTGRMDLAFNIPTFGEIHLRDELTGAFGLPVLVENDVNMAVLGEQWAGLGVGRDNVVFVAVGTGLGMGMVVDGELRRGKRGAAGEIAYLPLGSDPLDPSVHLKGALEEAVAGAAIVRRHAQRAHAEGVEPLDSVPAILTAADAGDEVASAVVDAVALDLAMGIAAVAAVLDPELVVLGGGIGSHPMFASRVEQALPQVSPLRTQIAVSDLGHRASLIGAVAVGVRATRQGLFDSDGHAATAVARGVSGRNVS